MQYFSQMIIGGLSISIYAINGGIVRGRGCGGGRFGGRDRGHGGGNGRCHGRGGGSDKVINGVDISDTNIIFTNEVWENIPGWERSDMQQISDRICDIDKSITETRNKNRKTSAVGITN